MNTPVRKTRPAFRALIQYARLPAGHMTFRVEDDGSDPHLRESEFAVVDTADREVQHGELYVIQYQSGRRTRRIVQVRKSMAQITATGPKQQVWWTCDLAGFRQVTRMAEGGIPEFRGLSDGPYKLDHLQGRLLGRVVGFAATALGDPMPPELGFEDEAAGNAAFDPAEYLDTMIRLGHRPYLMRHGDRLTYFEQMPGRALMDDDYFDLLAVRWKYVKASTALVRVMEECERRGYVA